MCTEGIYSSDGASNLYFFNEETILYIEDAKGVGIYEEFINEKLKEYSSKINIVAANGKKGVKEIFNNLKEREELEKKLFIVDLDYDKFLEENMINNLKFLYLKKYTLENYMVSENSALKIISIRNSISKKNIHNIFNYNEWINKIEIYYRKLIPIFLTLRFNQINIENCGAKAERFFLKENCELCSDKLGSYIRKIKEKGFSESDDKFIYFLEKIRNDSKIDIAIPGKQLLTLFRFELNKILNTKIDNDIDFITMLAPYLEEEFENLLKDFFVKNFE